MNASKLKRKTFAAREDLIDGMNKIARQRGLSLYSFVNEAFELALRAEELGINLQNLIEEREFLKSVKEMGFILGLENLWYEMAELAYDKDRDEALKRWFDAGVWMAKRYESSGSENPVPAFEEKLKTLTWNASELSIDQADGRISVRVISPRFPESYTFLFTAFLEGALKAFGYRNVSKDVSTGTIRLTANR